MNVEKKKPFVQSSFPFLLTRCEDWLIEVLNIRPKMSWQLFWSSKDIVYWVQNDVRIEICSFAVNFKISATITYHASEWQAWGNNWSWSEDWLIEVLNIRPKMSWQLFWSYVAGQNENLDKWMNKSENSHRDASVWVCRFNSFLTASYVVQKMKLWKRI